VTIFVEENHGQSYTEIHSLKIFGEAVMGTDVAAIKGKEEEIEERGEQRKGRRRDGEGDKRRRRIGEGGGERIKSGRRREEGE
jgi:hypothetical protein